MCKNLIYFMVIGLFLGTVAHAGTDVFSVNFYDPRNLAGDARLNVTIEPEQSAGFGAWETTGWVNVFVERGMAPVSITSAMGRTATVALPMVRNAWRSRTLDGSRAAAVGDGNGDLFDVGAWGTEDQSLILDMMVSDIPFSAYDVIVYLGHHPGAGGARTGVITFNETPMEITVLAGAFNGTFAQIVNSGDTGNYIVYENVKGSDFTIQLVGHGTNHTGICGFQVRQAALELAANPSPADEATDLPRDGLVLGWTPGEYAAQHDIYLGVSFDDVNNATTASEAYQSRQVGSSFALPRLEFGTEYFWRIDEVNAPPGSTIFKGDVWSFATEPVAYLITDVQASASSSSSAESEPANLVNGSGLTLAADGQWVHGTDEKTMWQSAPSGLPATVVFEFDGSYKLREMKLWNHNTSNEGLFGIGAKEVTIEVADSNEGPWTVVADVTLPRAPGLPDTPATDTIPMLGVMAGSVRLTIRSSQGGVAAAGLAEVQFFYIPVAPRELAPADGTTLTEPEATLAWRSGREAAEHRVYLATAEERALVEGSDPAALAATVAAEGPYASYTPTGLNLLQTYVWKITEVNAAEIPATHDSAILSFTTPEYIAVDDMESYKDGSPNRVFQTWIDGVGFSPDEFLPQGNSGNGSGSGVGHDIWTPGTPYTTIMETTTVHAGKQSMPFYYDNTSVAYSEATRTFESPQDWTAHGIKSLSLWFYGDPANSGGRLYVKINNGAPIFYDSDPTDLAKAIWQPFNIDLSTVGGGVSSVTKLSIGVQDAGAKGVLRIDDVRLYPYDRQLITPTDPGTAGLQAQYLFEGNAADSSGNGRAGTLVGDPVFVAGKDGQAISLDGLDDYVNIDGYKGILADANGVQNPFTLCAWISATSDGEIITWGTNAAGQRMTFRVDTVLRVENAAGNVRGTNGPDLRDGEWHHVAATVPQGAEMMDVTLYVDGSNVTPPNTTTGLFNLQPDVDVRIGMGGPTGGRFLTGAVDDARIYDRVLSVGEIAFLAGKTLPFDKSF